MADKYITDENGVTFNESGELVADVVQQPTIEVDPETANMENLAISNHAKYLTTYNTPKDWVLDEKEARLAQIQQNAWTPEQASRVGSLKYGVKQFLIDTYDTPQELGAAISLGAAKVEDAFYPNADKTAIERWYENYGKLNVESDKIVDEYMSSHAGKHPYWLMGGSVALGLARDMAVAGGFAKLGASVAAKKATSKVAERYVGEDVAARYVGMAAQTGAKKAGQKAIVGSVFAQEFGSSTMGDVAEYIQKTGDSELKYYDPTVDLATNLGVSLLSAQIEKGLGVERFVPRLVASAVRRGEKVPALAQVIIRGVEGGIGEMSEEPLQEGLSQLGDMIKGYKDWWDFDTDNIITGAVLGAIGGTGASAGLHYINRRIAINRLKAEGLDENTAADLVDTIVSDETNKTLNNLSAVNELKTQNGQAYEKLKTAMKRALETQGWKDKIIKDGVPMDIDEYVSLNAKDFIKPAIYYSNKYNLPIDLFLDVAEFTGFNNVLVMRDLGTAEQIKAKIDAQTNIIKTQQELKKTGAGDSGVLNRAKINKAILQKAYVNATLSQEIQKVNLEEAQTPETKQEILTANEDADVLGKKETVEDFNAEMNNKTQNGVPLTADQKNKRFGNAVIKRIFGKDKLGFETVMTLPEYANARQGILNSAMRIFDFVKKHRTYGLYMDLRNALNQMQTVNQTNFIESVTTPSLDGRDVIAQNAFLYHFLFSDSNTITAFVDAYLQRAEASINGETKTDLSKKDLIGQSFEAVDKMLQIKAEASGTQYISIYNEDGSIADKNVAAVMLSYQNQFVQEQGQQTQPEGEVKAEDVVDGTITEGTPETTENVIEDYGEKIEGAKKDLVGTKTMVAQSDIDKIMKKAPKHEEEQKVLENWLKEQDPSFVALIKDLRLPIVVMKSDNYKQQLRDAYDKEYNLRYEKSLMDVIYGWDELSDETVKRLGITPEYNFYFKSGEHSITELTPVNVLLRLGRRGAFTFQYAKSTNGNLYLWGKKGSGSWLPLIKFDTKEDMDAHKASHNQEELEKIYTDMTTYKAPKEKAIRQRLGQDYRNGKNVTEKEFADTFGFRGVQFGNYENQEKRQKEINNSYDSFMDLANILNLPPKAISLNGTLGIAFGARGSGSALAHYEPDLKVINITRDAGAGALGHEWFHALDNYLANNLSENANRVGGGWITKSGNWWYYQGNQELADSLKDYQKAIKAEDTFQTRLRLLGQYWKRDWEVGARLFEQYISSKIAEKNNINDYLANPQEYYQQATPYLTTDEASRVFPKIEKMLSSIKIREGENGNIILFQEQFDLADENARLDDIYPAYDGETIEVDGKERTVYNSNGERIAQSEPALRNFYKWFSDSKVVDEQGRPLVVYHGTKAQFDEFDINIPRTGVDIFGRGFYFTPYKNKAKFYGKIVMPVYLSITNPENITELTPDTLNPDTAKLKEEGKNGIIFDRTTDKTDELLTYVAFDSTQIKSVNNRGTYSSDTPNIYFQSRVANGFFDPELNTIVLGKNFNTMTLPHEMAHYWLETLFNVYKRMQVGQLTSNAGFMQEVKSMFDMLGINEAQESITRGQHEKFARMTEAYLTGIGVSPEMNQTYKAYLKWIPEKYKSLQQLAYLDDEGRVKLPFLDQKAVDFFNRWYENPVLPSLSTSPERQRFMNVTGTNGDVITVSIKEMNDREKEFAQDAEEQIHADERLYNTLKENMPGDIKATADAQKVVINERSNFLKEAQAKQKEIKEEPERRWFERKSRETEIQKAKEYLANNLDHAKDVIYGDPEFIPNDTGVDRATLINTYMSLNNITPQHSDWAILHTNIAINQSLAGTQLALSNNQSYGSYLDALREVENVLELKAATNYAGSKNGAKERFNIDIRRFLDQELPAIFATEPNSKEREQALRMLFEKARTTFSGNTTGGVLNQMDLDYAKSQKRKTEAFVNWAMNQIKKDAGAKLSNEKMAKLLEISAKAQQALIDLDNPDSAKAVAAALDIIKWQMEKNKLMGVSPKKFSFFGDWMPRAMLASFNTLLVTNPPSTFMNTWIVRALRSDIFGKNKVSDSLIEKEIKRIKAIYNATGMNLAQMEKPTSPSLLHGEKYSTSGQKWYDPYTILGREDNFFRVPTFVNTLARIASTDAKATGRNANEVFQEYLSLSNQTDEAKLARKQALAVANMAVFTQNGGLAKCLNHIRSELNKLSRTAIGLDPQGFGLGNLLSPFLTTGANIAEMGIRGSLAPVTTIATMVNKWRTGKALDPMKKLALRMDWAYFTFSALSVALLAALTSDDDEFYTDPYITGRKYDPNKPYDSINLGGVWLDLDFFGPFAIPMRTAAKAIQEWKKDNGILAGYGDSAKTVLGDIPLAETIINNQISWATKKPGDWATSYLYNQANKAIPAIVKPVSRAASRGAGVQFDAQDWIGQIAGRKFHRNYGFDGAELTTQDLIDILTIKIQLDEELNK